MKGSVSVQTTLEKGKYEQLLGLSDSLGLSVDAVVRKAINMLLKEKKRGNDDPLFTTKPVDFGTVTSPEMIDDVIYGKVK